MSYDLLMFRPRRGRSVDDVLRAEFEDRPEVVEELSQAEMGSLATKIEKACPELERLDADDEDDLGPTVEFSAEDAPVEGLLTIDELSVGLAYGLEEGELRPVMDLAWRFVRCCAEVGFKLFDPQTERELDIAAGPHAIMDSYAECNASIGFDPDTDTDSDDEEGEEEGPAAG